MTRRKRYSAEFKREALRRANEEGVTDVLVDFAAFNGKARRVSLNQGLAHGPGPELQIVAVCSRRS